MAKNSIGYHDARHLAAKDEFKTLFDVTRKAIQGEPDGLFQRVNDALDKDLTFIESKTFSLDAGDSIPLKTNKLPYLLTGAKILSAEFLSNPEACMKRVITESQAQGLKFEYTALQDYLQTLMLETLSVIHNKDIFSISQGIGIYTPDESPNIQGVTGSSLKSDDFKDFRWFFVHNGRPELLVPTEGYFFGGGRDDIYSAKEYKAHDCSSLVQEWYNIPGVFVTSQLLDLLKGQKSGVGEILKPLGEDRDPKMDDVFFITGHCGVVSKYHDSTLEVLSDTRLMPFRDGFVIQEYGLTPKPNIFGLSKAGFEAKALDAPVLISAEVLKPFYGLDSNDTHVKLSADMVFFESNV